MGEPSVIFHPLRAVRKAVLRQNVVPTSGWRSCTAVPVELTASNVAAFRGEADKVEVQNHGKSNLTLEK